MCNKFSSRFDAKIPGVHSRAEVAEGRRALCRKILGAEGLLVMAGEGLGSKIFLFWLIGNT